MYSSVWLHNKCLFLFVLAGQVASPPASLFAFVSDDVIKVVAVRFAFEKKGNAVGFIALS